MKLLVNHGQCKGRLARKKGPVVVVAVSKRDSQ